MTVAVLFHPPSVEEVYGRDAAIAASVSLGVAMVWLVIAHFQRKPGDRIALPWLFWVFADSSVALLLVAVLAMLAAHSNRAKDLKVSRAPSVGVIVGTPPSVLILSAARPMNHIVRTSKAALGAD